MKALPPFLTWFSSLTFAFLACTSSSRAELVGHWVLDEGTGTVAGDSSGNTRTGTLAGGALWSTTDLPPVPAGTTSSLDLDGSDDQVNIVGYKGITGTGARSVTAWVRTRIVGTNQNMCIVSWGANTAGNKWTFRVQANNGTPGAIRVEVNGGFFVGNTVVTDGEWHHVAVTWEDDGTPDVQDAKLYVDGVLDADLDDLSKQPSASQSQTMDTASSADVLIGDDFQTVRYWNGWIDDVRIYDEAIDETTVAALAQGTAILTTFEADSEIVASGAPVVLSWVSDLANDTLELDNGIGDVSGTTMTTVNPTSDTTYTLTGTRGGTTNQREITILVEKSPVINSLTIPGAATVFAGDSLELRWNVFGEATLDLNGTDVSGQDETTLSPAETTTYILSATNPWGTSTAEVTVTVLPADSPELSWTAAGLPDGNLVAWTPEINATGNAAVAFTNGTGGTVESGASNFTGVSQWVNSPGYNLAANSLDSWHDIVGNATTQADVSWEMVFRPGDFTDTHTLFNTGGNGDGTAFVLTDSVLDFRFQDADAAAQRLILSTDLATIGAATDFYHVVGICDVDSATTGTATLYVNGELVAGPTTSTGNIQDWDGGDLAELGKGNNIPGSGGFGPAAFTGDVALFNYFPGRLLGEAEISAAFEAVAGERAPFMITSIVYNDAEQRMEITFNSRPGLIYAIDGGDDPTNFAEIDDSIISEGTETTVFLPGISLPDENLRREFYQIRLTE